MFYCTSFFSAFAASVVLKSLIFLVRTNASLGEIWEGLFGWVFSPSNLPVVKIDFWNLHQAVPFWDGSVDLFTRCLQPEVRNVQKWESHQCRLLRGVFIDHEPCDEGEGTNKIPQAQLVSVVHQKTFFNKLNRESFSFSILIKSTVLCLHPF